eukprot:scaffold65433_cov66-Phaeocystis_antarctica.AAC.14
MSNLPLSRAVTLPRFVTPLGALMSTEPTVAVGSMANTSLGTEAEARSSPVSVTCTLERRCTSVGPEISTGRRDGSIANTA